MSATSTANEIGTTYLRNGDELKIVEWPESGYRTERYAVNEMGERARFDGHMVPIRIQLETFNRLEQGVGERIVVKGGLARIYLSDLLVYTLEFADIIPGLRRVEEAVKKLMEFRPVRHWTREEVREKIINRRVFYWNQPAIVTDFVGEKGLVILEADGDHDLLTPYESPPGKTLEEDLLSDLIYWWREE